MSCAGTPSWSGGRGWGDHSRGRRHHDRIRFGAAFLTVVFELPLSDVTVVDGEEAVLGCRVTVAPVAEVNLVSIVREVECEMGSIGGPVPKSSTRRTDPHTSTAPLNNNDREMSPFYATQIDADVDASPTHRLVYVGDIIARHVTNQSVGDRIAPAATELCGQLELIAMTTRTAVSGNRRLAEKRTANTWIGTDTGSGDCGGLFR